MSYLKLILIRHAQSVGNAQKRMEGQSSTALTDLGNQQANLLAISMVPVAPNRPPADWPTYLYSSPLLRAQQTTQHLATALQQAGHSFQPVLDCRLQEIHQGIFQGLTWAEAQTQFPDLCAQLMSSLEWQPVPGAESPGAARARSHQWLRHVLTTHHPGDTVWAVSHAGIMLHLVAEIMGCDRTWKTKIDHTAVFEFWLSPVSPGRPSKEDQTEVFNPELWVLNRFNQAL